MKTNFMIIFLFLCFTQMANAIVINDEIFKENGGDINNIPESIKYYNEPLKEISYSQKYLAVGKVRSSLGECTGTWIGDDDQGWSYILTAAHCIPYNDVKTPVNVSFISWNGITVAEGDGFGFVMEDTLNPTPEIPITATDMAILKLPRIEGLLDKNGSPVQQPILYDESDELNHTVNFVGYGNWGVGLDTSRSYKSYDGDKRLWGQATSIRQIIQSGRALQYFYDPTGHTEAFADAGNWARLSHGDSGSAWWQDIKGKNVIIATCTQGFYTINVGTRVSINTDWIKSIYSGARFYSTEFLDWGKDDRKGSVGDLYQYDNPYRREWEIYKLVKLDPDGTYGEFPLETRDNRNWSYIGPYIWGINGHIGFIYQDPHDDGTTDLFTLTGRDPDRSYGPFPEDKGNNQWWTFFKTIPNDNYASVDLFFQMVICGNNERCSRAKGTMSQKVYTKLGSPTSAKYRYAKLLRLPDFTSTGFTYDDSIEEYTTEQIYDSDTPVNQGYYLGLKTVCLIDGSGNSSCAQRVITVDVGEDVKYMIMRFPAPTQDDPEKTVHVRLGIGSEQCADALCLRVQIFMNEQTYNDLGQPVTTAFTSLRYKNYDAAAVSIVADGSGGYYFGKIEQSNPSQPTDRHSFQLIQVCMGEDNCVNTDIIDGHGSGGYIKQSRNFSAVQ